MARARTLSLLIGHECRTSLNLSSFRDKKTAQLKQTNKKHLHLHLYRTLDEYLNTYDKSVGNFNLIILSVTLYIISYFVVLFQKKSFFCRMKMIFILIVAVILIGLYRSWNHKYIQINVMECLIQFTKTNSFVCDLKSLTTVLTKYIY